MYNSYIIKKVNEISAGIDWEQIPELNVDNFPWDETGYRPKTVAKICYSNKGLHVFLKSYEKNIRAVNNCINDPVCQDSCMEFFFNPNPEKDDRYMNLEMNPIGTFLLGFGKDRHTRGQLKNLNNETFEIKTVVNKENVKCFDEDFWTLEYIIPFSFMEQYYGILEIKPGKKLKGNVYKCGDKTEIPHYGCWNRINWEKPDFHRPDFFGEFILGE